MILGHNFFFLNLLPPFSSVFLRWSEKLLSSRTRLCFYHGDLRRHWSIFLSTFVTVGRPSEMDVFVHTRWSCSGNGTWQFTSCCVLAILSNCCLTSRERETISKTAKRLYFQTLSSPKVISPPRLQFKVKPLLNL